MGSTPPVRRFNAHRACVRYGLSHGRSRARALPALSCPFRGVRRSPVRSRRPVGRLVGPHNHSWAFFALRHSLGARARDDRGSTRDPPAACGGLATSCATSPSSSRRAKRRSVHGLHPSGHSLRARRCPLSGALPSWRCRPPRRTVRCTRERGRLQGLVLGTGPFVTDPCGPAVGALLGFPPPERSLHPSGHSALIARPPLAPPSRADVPARRSHRVLRSGWIGVVRFRTAGSHGVRHLLTVAALRSPDPGAGSWFHLARDARLSPPFLRSEPPGIWCSLWPGP
jgi:hypothetical protein